MGAVAKWITIGVLGLAGITAIFVSVLIWKFSPILSVDEKSGRVTFLGGAIEILDPKNAIDVPFRTHIAEWADEMAKLDQGDFAGSESMISKPPGYRIKFTNGQFEVTTLNKGLPATWDCDRFAVKQGTPLPKAVWTDEGLNLDMSAALAMDCEIGVPTGVIFVLEGTNGSVVLDEPNFNAKVTMVNGRIRVEPKLGPDYNTKVSVQNGKADAWPTTSTKPSVPRIELSLTNGVVQVRRDS